MNPVQPAFQQKFHQDSVWVENGSHIVARPAVERAGSPVKTPYAAFQGIIAIGPDLQTCTGLTRKPIVARIS